MTEPHLITETPEWQRLAEHHESMAGVHLRDLFADDPKRGETMTVEAGDLFLDYSKNRITAEALDLLAALAVRAGLPERIEAMWRGEPINTTEHRSVLEPARDAVPVDTTGLELDDVIDQIVMLATEAKEIGA